jgi:hypothetical protein
MFCFLFSERLGKLIEEEFQQKILEWQLKEQQKKQLKEKQQKQQKTPEKKPAGTCNYISYAFSYKFLSLY